jgi:hypothetical protein
VTPVPVTFPLVIPWSSTKSPGERTVLPLMGTQYSPGGSGFGAGYVRQPVCSRLGWFAVRSARYAQPVIVWHGSVTATDFIGCASGYDPPPGPFPT